MTIDATHWSRIKAIVADTEDLPPDARDAFVRTACGDDRRMARAVLRLLRHDEDRRLLRTDPFALGARRDGTPELASGSRFGPFVIERLLGTGASSRVYEATEDDPSRRVALKVLTAANPTAEERWRFRHEAALLAKLRHPGIAAVLHAGETRVGDHTASWFAMELVEPARDFTTFVAPLARTARLHAFLAVTDAVRFGHRHGVLHRDLKPENILVGGDDQPKIIDFGVGRLITPGAPGAPALTEQGQFVGTLAYASPEQLSGDVARVDTRTDVYALGVMLFEILTDRPPIALGGLAFHDVVHAVCNAAPDEAAFVRADVPRDLRSIARRALHKDREARYPSADALADDLRRYLAGFPVAARRTPLIRRAALFAQRHARAVIATVAVTLTVLAAVGWHWHTRERTARTIAAHESYGRGFRDVLYRMIALANPVVTGRRGATSQRILETAVGAVEEQLASSPTAMAEALASVAGVYQGLGEHRLALAQWKRVCGLVEHTPLISRDCVLLARFGLATALSNLGDHDEAIRILEAEHDRAVELGFPEIAVRCLFGQGVAHRRANRLPAARRACDAALRQLAAVPSAHALRADCLQLHGLLLMASGDSNGARAAFRDGIAAIEQASEPYEGLLARLRLHLGALVHDGDPAAAEALYRAAMPFQLGATPPDDPDRATLLSSLGNVLRMQQRAAAGEPFLRRAVDWLFEHNAVDHPNATRIIGSFVGVLYDLDRHVEALPYLERGVRTFRGETQRSAGRALHDLRRMLRERRALTSTSPALPRSG